MKSVIFTGMALALTSFTPCSAGEYFFCVESDIKFRDPLIKIRKDHKSHEKYIIETTEESNHNTYQFRKFKIDTPIMSCIIPASTIVQIGNYDKIIVHSKSIVCHDEKLLFNLDTESGTFSFANLGIFETDAASLFALNNLKTKSEGNSPKLALIASGPFLTTGHCENIK
jgi:hypothetical protein